MTPDEQNTQHLDALYESSTRNKKHYVHTDPSADILESFSVEEGRSQVVRIHCPEFTSLCPVTGQPDFATIYISYVPSVLCVESKSLKLYLGRFRNHGEFHESCVKRIHDDIVKKIDPLAIQVVGDFTPRGGLAIKPLSFTYEPDIFSVHVNGAAELLQQVMRWGTSRTHE